MSLTIKVKEKGLKKLFKDYETSALTYLWNKNTNTSSREVWQKVNENPDIKVSGASIINFLNEMVDESLLLYEDTTGKGGVRRLYRPKYTREKTLEKIISNAIESLLLDFKTETLAAINTYRDAPSIEKQPSEISTVFNAVLLDFFKLEKATLDEIYTVAVKYHGLQTDKETIKIIMEIASQPPISMIRESEGVYYQISK